MAAKGPIRPGLVLVASKMDNEARREVSQQRAMQWCTQIKKRYLRGLLNVPYFETSARVVGEGAHMSEVLAACLKLAEQREHLLHQAAEGLPLTPAGDAQGGKGGAGALLGGGGGGSRRAKGSSTWAMCAQPRAYDDDDVGPPAPSRGGGDSTGRCTIQ